MLLEFSTLCIKSGGHRIRIQVIPVAHLEPGINEDLLAKFGRSPVPTQADGIY